MPEGRHSLSKLVYVAAGAALIAAAAAIPGEEYSKMLSSSSKDLTWGPSLFRVLLAFHGCVLIAIGAVRTSRRQNDTSEPGSRPAMGTKVLAAMILLSFLALFLRLWNLNSAPWIDEVLTLVDFVRLPMGEIFITFPSQNQHMLYSLLARVSFDVFGESIWALRLPAVVFGVGSIWALFYFARSVLGLREALLASALMTVSYHHIWFSQNARGYTGLLMMTLLATGAYLTALRQNSWKHWLLYAVALVIGMWIHLTMAFVVAAHAVVFLMFALMPSWSGENDVSLERRCGSKTLVAWVLAGTATLQLYALSIPEFIATGLHEESRNSQWTSPIWVLTESVQNLSIGLSGIAVALFAVLFVLFGWARIFGRDRRAAILMVLPPMIAGCVMLTLGHNLFPRFFFFAMGFGLLIAIHGALELPFALQRMIRSLPGSTALGARAGVAFSAVMIVASLLTVPRNYAMPKQDFPGAKEFVESRLAPDSTAVAVNLAGDIFARYYAPNWRTTRDIAEIERLRNENRSLWLVYTMPFEIEAFNPEIWKTIRDDFTVVQRFPGTLNGGDVVVCRHMQSTEEKNESNKTISESNYDPAR